MSSKQNLGNVANRFRLFHPFLFAIYPVLAALARNIQEVNPSEIFRPILAALVSASLLFFLLIRLIHPPDRGALATSLLLIFLFDYGYYTRLPVSLQVLGVPVHRHLVIILFWILFSTIVINNRLWRQIRPHMITRYMNLLAIISFIFPMRIIITNFYSINKNPLTEWKYPLTDLAEPSDQPASLPDIYYIILDGYGRADIFEDVYQFDNSEFINSLTQRDFYVAHEAQSNYEQSALSFASSLNMTYLDELSFAAGVTNNRYPLFDLIKTNRVVNFLKKRGYTIIALDGGLQFANFSEVDLNLSYHTTKITSLEALLFETTALRIPFDLFKWRFPVPEYSTHRERIIYTFEELMKITTIPGPKFIFAHIMAAHPPFVFDASGNPITPDQPFYLADGSHFPGSTSEYISSYSQQVSYINQLILREVDAILNNSSTPPIIILQGDHGPGAFLNHDSVEKSCIKERTSILNAYYLPSEDYSQLYPAITPVNSFRLIFNAYFNMDLDILPDSFYFSTWPDPYNFIDVTESRSEVCTP